MFSTTPDAKGHVSVPIGGVDAYVHDEADAVDVRRLPTLRSDAEFA